MTKINKIVIDKRALIAFLLFLTAAFCASAQDKYIPKLEVDDIFVNNYIIHDGDTIYFGEFDGSSYVKYTDAGDVFVTTTQLLDTTEAAIEAYDEEISERLLEKVNLSDSSDVFYTQTQVDSLLSAAGLQTVYVINLPYASTVAGRVASATDYPDGWTLEADGLNLKVTHNMGRNIADATVWTATSGTIKQKLTNTSAYNGLFQLDENSVQLNSLATVEKDIVVYLIFE